MMADGPPQGHIKLARKQFDAEHGDPLWCEPRSFSRWEAWVDLIQLAAFAPYVHNTTHYGAIELDRGEFVASLRYLGTRWKWTVKRVRNFLSTILKWDRLRAQRETTAGTVYLIVNYDTYQSVGHSDGTARGTPKGTAGAQQGHKREASKAIQAITTSRDEESEAVVRHYLTTHPSRRRSSAGMAAARRALAQGYTVSQLCDAIDGNAFDEWHVAKHKHEMDYVLRNSDKIEQFRAAKLANTPKLAVDPTTGLPNAVGLGVIDGGRKHAS